MNDGDTMSHLLVQVLEVPARLPGDPEPVNGEHEHEYEATVSENDQFVGVRRGEQRLNLARGEPLSRGFVWGLRRIRYGSLDR